jgi:hypothetical protein
MCVYPTLYNVYQARALSNIMTCLILLKLHVLYLNMDFHYTNKWIALLPIHACLSTTS